jgi:RHS repeat-associated protein
LALFAASCGDNEAAEPQPDGGRGDGGSVVAKAEALTTPVTTTLNAIADTKITQAQSTFNYGTSSSIKVTGSGLSAWEAGLVKFDAAAIQAAIGTGTLQSATLQLTISTASLGWGDSRLSVSRMTKSWNETGATWLCANDTDQSLLGKYLNNCASADRWGIEWWSFLPRPYAEPATATVALPFGTTGVLSANVTADIQAMSSGTPHQGWMLSSTAAISSVWVQFNARESGIAPKLVLSVLPACAVLGPDNNCNGRDDDCDGITDEAYVPTSSTCGVGACARTGTNTCSNGVISNSCTPGTPGASDATCNGIDENCNGQKDEGYVGTTTPCGSGICANTGTSLCVNGSVTPNCSPKPLLSMVDTTCDGIDDDCSGQPDEDYATMSTMCGVGACAGSGTRTCVNGQAVDSCVAGTPASTDTTCNGVDEDCNGQTDDGYVPVQTSCTKAGCLAHGMSLCSGGQVADNCAASGTCYQETDCTDGADNDGDGPKDCADGDCASAPACASSVPDPRLIAPATDLTHFASTYELGQFLFNGAGPIQSGVNASAIPPERFGIARGRVLAPNGAPLRDVTVSVVNRPEFGSTVTRADGQFDFALNGGVQRQFAFARSGYLTVQRPVQVNWDTFSTLEDVILTPLAPVAGTVNLSNTAPQVIRAPVQMDQDGLRQPTLLFPQAIGAQMVMPNGSVQPLSQMTVHVTEFSISGLGTSAMPAQLPPHSNHAFVAAFDVAEATAAGAASVQFSAPVPLYLENFLDLQIGSGLAVNTHDPANGIWRTSTAGRVVKVLSITGGMADLDTNGDAIPDDAARLAALGVTPTERTNLASLYAPGASLLRVPLNHFSNVDVEWCAAHPNPVVNDELGVVEYCIQILTGGHVAPDEPVEGGDYPPETASSQDQANLNGQDIPDNSGQGGGEPLDTPVVPSGDDSSAEAPDAPIDDPCSRSGASTIAVENGTLREDVPIAGTPFTLNYASNRTQTAVSRGLKFVVPVSDGSPRAGTYRGASVRVDVGGRVLSADLPMDDTQEQVTLTWDGLNAYGKPMVGATRATIRTCYYYKAPHRRELVSLCSSYSEHVTPYLSTAFGPDGWMLSAQHVYDTTGRVLTLGNGLQTSATGRPLGYVVKDAYSHLVGWENGNTDLNNVGASGFVQLADGNVIAMGPNSVSNIVIPMLLVPKNTYAGDISGLSGDLTAYWRNQSWLGQVNIFPGPNGTIYARERANGPNNTVRDEVRRYTLDASDRIVQSGAVVATNVNPIATGPDGSLYAWGTPGQLLEYTPDGVSSVLYQSPNVDAAGKNTVAIKGNAPGALTWNTWLVAVGPNGAVYVLEQWVASGIRAFGLLYALPPQGGRIELLNTAEYEAGNPDTNPNDSTGVTAMTIDPTTNRVTMGVGVRARIVQVIPGRVLTLVGENFGSIPGFGEPLKLPPTRLWYVQNMAYGPDGLLYFSQRFGAGRVSAIRRVEPNYPGADLLPLGKFQLPSEDGHDIFYFDSGGRQIETRDADTGDLIYSFGYTQGWLTSITDRFGKQTRVVRDAAGTVQEIIAPFGQTTTIDVDGAGQIESVTAPDNTRYEFTYDANGMLSTLKNPREYTSQHAFDSEGKLTIDSDAAGGGQVFMRTAPGTVDVTTAENVQSSYGFERGTNGLSRVITFADGSKNESVETALRQTVVTRGDGTRITTKLEPDPVWGMMAAFPSQETIQYPSGRGSLTTVTRTATPLDANQPFGPVNRTQTTIMNGLTTTQSFAATTRTLTVTSAEGRVTTSSRDAAGTHLQLMAPGRATQRTTLDAQGRPTTITLDDGTTQRTTTFTYDANSGYPSTIAGPVPGELKTLTSDSFGRVISEQKASGAAVLYGFDPIGNLSSETPPTRAAHQLDYTPVDLVSSYRAPDPMDAQSLAEQVSYLYTLDKNAKHVSFADGQDIEYTYNDGGQLNTIATERGSDQYSYEVQSGKLASIVSDDGRELTFGYDGNVPTTVSWSGTGHVSGSVSMAYDANSWLSEVRVNGNTISGFTRDRDGLLKVAGPLNITRDPASGDVTTTSLTNVTTTEATNRFGEQSGYSASFNAAPLYAEQVALRDLAGRIVDRTESVLGMTHAYHYAYDLKGRLTDVSIDGTLQAHYVYDENGNRSSLELANGTRTAVYDNQDRLNSYGAFTYDYSAVGSLTHKTNTQTGEVTTYDYDSFGNLRNVQLADGRHLFYEVDAQNRRIAKRVNGVRNFGLLYKDQLAPVAQLAADNSVVSTFTYGTRANVPDYMTKNGIVYRFLVDHLGSVRMVVNAADGTVAQRIEYDEFGNVLLDTAPGFQPFGFAGGLYDADTGLVRFGVRDYDAVTGRWTAKDPIGFVGGDANLYAYVFNDPVNLIDPSGAILPVLLGGAVGGAVIGGAIGAAMGAIKAAAAGGDWSDIGSSALTGAATGAVTGALAGLGAAIPGAMTVAIAGGAVAGSGAQFALGFGAALLNPKLPGLAAVAATTLVKDVLHPQKVSGQPGEESGPCAH